MTESRPAVERRILSAMDAEPARIPFLLGPCGIGRTTTLLQLRETIGSSRCQYVDVEQAATTPEGFLRSVTDASPFSSAAHLRPLHDGLSAREAFQEALAFLVSARTGEGEPVTFLLDEALELRTFDSFPGLRMVLRDLVRALQHSENRFVLTTRYVNRAHRLLRDAPPEYEVVHLPPLSPAEVADALSDDYAPLDTLGRAELARTVHALTDGRPGYIRCLDDAMKAMGGRGADDPVAALTGQMSRGTPLYGCCRFCYELRLHRARGYGALKAILQVLAEEESLTLTEVAQRLRRTPGSTKDYLSWLEDVDLIMARQKRYSFTDPLLRLWVRLHCRSQPLDDEALAREVQRFAHTVLPNVEPTLAFAAVEAPPTVGQRDRSWSVVEID